jgi:hypothetical protein
MRTATIDSVQNLEALMRPQRLAGASGTILK